MTQQLFEREPEERYHAPLRSQLAERTRIIFGHINPRMLRGIEMRPAESFDSISEHGSGVLTQGVITQAEFHLYKILYSEYCSDLGKIAEELFAGGRYAYELDAYHDDDGFADVIRIGEIPSFPQVEIATLILPGSAATMEACSHPERHNYHMVDLSLDILLKQTQGVKDRDRISLRVPLSWTDVRIPEFCSGNTGRDYLFKCEYTRSGESLELLKSYASTEALIEGIRGELTKYNYSK